MRVPPVQMPTQGIINDVFPYPVERIFVPDYVFIVIALPEPALKRSPAKSLDPLQHTFNKRCKYFYILTAKLA
jgi:hypothetical protein